MLNYKNKRFAKMDKTKTNYRTAVARIAVQWQLSRCGQQ